MPTVAFAAPVVNVNEDIRQILADAYDETEEDEQSSKQKTYPKKAFSDDSKSVRTKRNTYANRFDSAVAMRFDKADEIEDEAERWGNKNALKFVTFFTEKTFRHDFDTFC